MQHRLCSIRSWYLNVIITYMKKLIWTCNHHHCPIIYRVTHASTWHWLGTLGIEHWTSKHFQDAWSTSRLQWASWQASSVALTDHIYLSYQIMMHSLQLKCLLPNDSGSHLLMGIVLSLLCRVMMIMRYSPYSLALRCSEPWVRCCATWWSCLRGWRGSVSWFCPFILNVKSMRNRSFWWDKKTFQRIKIPIWHFLSNVGFKCKPLNYCFLQVERILLAL